jgi:hypothetical protein
MHASAELQYLDGDPGSLEFIYNFTPEEDVGRLVEQAQSYLGGPAEEH